MATIFMNKPKEGLPKRSDKDFYETPYSVAVATMGVMKTLYGERFFHFIDAGAGTGVWGKAVNQVYKYRRTVLGVELRDCPKPEGYTSWYNNSDYMKLPSLSTSYWDLHTFVIGNPPFSLAAEFIEKSFEIMNGHGVCGFLLPSDFLYSQERMLDLFGKYPLKYVFPYSKRIHFVGAGDRNPNNYSFYLFDTVNTAAHRPEIIWINHGDMTYRDGSHRMEIFKDEQKQDVK